MKHFTLLAIAFVAVMSLQAQNYVNVSFTSKMQDNAYHALDSVKVINVTRSWEEMLYYPDTVLQMINCVGINEVSGTEFRLFQNIPNPFQGSTEFSVQLPSDENLSVQLFDISGKQYASYSGKMTAGIHTFGIQVSFPQMYIVHVKSSHYQHSIKLTATEASDANRISYVNTISLTKENRIQKADTDNEFQAHDSLLFIGYTTYNQVKEVRQIGISQAGSDAVYTFTFAKGYALGDVHYDNNGLPEGVVCWLADTVFTDTDKAYGSRGKVVSLNESDSGLMYGTSHHTTHAFDSLDGRINTAIHMALRSDTSTYGYKERIEAAKWCTDKGEGWYFPAKCEMIALLNNIDTINITLQNIEATLISIWISGSGKGHYWTSTEATIDGSDNAWAWDICINENKLYITITPIYVECYVRAMKWFGE
ncbi:MAG: T9SS type A sorting domain-containing protein [Bacteroidales bacterium]|nr:T9SS type A sorting domain-containing protein [Bacteroidales bacterium]MDD4210059.1 T9SS type A sorting domain-containing protein [Bacteroidales bacterium]